jgi:hypothetical protein
MSILSVIKRFTAPALPFAGREYDQKYFNQLLSILRIYFNQLDNLLGQLVDGTAGGDVRFYGTALDAFGRARFSQPYTLFDSQNRYGLDDQFDSSNTGNGQVPSLITNESTVQMRITSGAAGSVIRQTFRSFSYQPGKSLLFMATFVMDSNTSSELTQRVGYFNTDNGVFLQRVGSTVSFVLRTNTSGTPSDARTVDQADWNVDKMDGTGPSAYTLDLADAQIFWADFEWLGVGSVRCGFVINGELIICHTFHNANIIDKVYMTTAILPVRYEIVASASITGGATLKQICSTVISEGGYQKKVANNVALIDSSYLLPISVAIADNWVPLVSIRLSTTRTGAVVIPANFSVLCTTTPADYEIALIKNPVFSSAPTFSTTGNLNVQYAIDGVIDYGGTPLTAYVYHTFASGSNQSGGAVGVEGDYNWDLQLGADISGTPTVFTLAVRAISGTESFYGSLSFWDLT